MPRFLNTSTGEFVWEVDPKTIVYAILSHTWRPDAEGGEQSYQDVLKLQAAVRQGTASSDSAPPYPTVLDHPDLSTKIKEACRVAREAGYGLLWLDSCCIDKSSSAELSEAINSMFEWYRFADMCYAYLEDFPDGEDPTDKSSCFRKCRWFRRGWTLQELIAPEQVFFLTRTWRFFGTKLALASVLKEITVVDFDILAGRAPLDSVSVAQRMSWAATRETTRVEDQAYCLLGLFDVHMPAIYGEGKNAFLRLQDEIIKTIPDQSIFAWGSSGVLKVADSGHEIGLTNTFPLTHAPGLLASDTWSFAPSAVRLVQTLIKVRTSMTSSAYGPRFPQPPYEAPDLLQHLYRTYNRIAPLSPADFIKRIGKPSNSPSPSLHCVFTPQGVQLRLFCINVGSIPPGGPSLPFLSCTTCRKENRYLDLLALLQCEDAEGRLIALPLCRPSSSVPGFKAYTVGWHRPLPFPCQDCCGGPPLYAGNVSHSVRLVPEVLTMLLPYLESEPREVLILRQYSDPPRLKSLQRSFSHFHETLNTPIDQIELAPGCDDRLRTLGFAISDVQIEHDTADQKIIVMASLVYPRLPPFRQVISVRLALETMVTSPSMTYSVRNLIPLAPDPDNDDITAASAGTPPRPQSPSDSVSSGAHWVCINEIRDMLPLTSYARILASVDLTIDDYTGPKEARGLSGSQRILRIVVEQPTLSPKGRDLPRIVLCPSFELSGSFVQPPAPTNNTCRRPTVNLERTHTTGVELGPGALLIAPGDGGEHDGTCNILNDIVAIQGYMGNMLGGTRSQARVLRPAHDAIVKAHELDEIVGLMDSLSQWSHHVDARIANEGGLLEALRSIRRSRLNTGDSDDQDAEIAERLQLEEFEDVLSSSTRTRGDVSRGAATVTAPFGTSILPRTTSTQFSAEESSAGKREVPPNPMETLKRKLEVAARNEALCQVPGATGPPRKRLRITDPTVTTNDATGIHPSECGDGVDSLMAIQLKLDEIRRDRPEFTESELQLLGSMLFDSAITSGAAPTTSMQQTIISSELNESSVAGTQPGSEFVEPGNIERVSSDVNIEYTGATQPQAGCGGVQSESITQAQALGLSSSSAVVIMHNEAPHPDTDGAKGTPVTALQSSRAREKMPETALTLSVSESASTNTPPPSHQTAETSSDKSHGVDLDADMMLAMSLQFD